MSGMAEVLAVHGWQGTPTACYCGWKIVEGFYRGGTVEAHAAHQASALTAAGFGDVREAKAQALEDAADWLEAVERPTRTASERLRAYATQAAVRGEG
jgi:putative IMPACT (imprinted ancient) family translation regulator